LGERFFRFSLFALGLWMMSQITADWCFWNFFLPQGVRGFATLLCIVPSVGMALNGVAPTELRYASGLFNLSRNMGGAVGIAVTTTWLGDFARLHALRLSEVRPVAPQWPDLMMGDTRATTLHREPACEPLRH